jgi:membrane-associated protein
MTDLFDWLLHIDDKLLEVTSQYRGWTYAILFGIIFAETGLVVTPILPGDSLLFAAGAIAGNPESGINVWILCVVLTLAAILGDTVNYHIGKYLGLRVLSGRLSRWLNPAHLKKTEQFFEKYGAKTIILARFVPIVRTFAPFVAGVGSMNYRRFVIYNIAGAVLWVFSLTFVGYIFGDRLKDHFEIVVLVIVFLSILPAVAEYLRHRFAAKTPAATPMEAEP